jgi:hypothetical protein
MRGLRFKVHFEKLLQQPRRRRRDRRRDRRRGHLDLMEIRHEESVSDCNHHHRLHRRHRHHVLNV